MEASSSSAGSSASEKRSERVAKRRELAAICRSSSAALDTP